MDENESILSGGRSTKSVVRIKGAVHRSMGQNSTFVHSILRYLEKMDFPYSPRFLGIDDRGREVLTFIEGGVPGGINLSEDQISACVKILRKLHDVLAASPYCDGGETICHRDFAPWNIVLNDDVPVGIIDFDDATPGKRMDDLAYFIWTFLDLGVSKISEEVQVRRILQLCSTYGLDYCEGVMEAMLREQNRILDFRRNIVLNAMDDELRDFSLRAIDRIELSKKWVHEHAIIIKQSLSTIS